MREAAFDDLARLWEEGVDSTQYAGEPGIPEYRYLLNSFFAGHPDQAERVKLGLIRLLQTENRASKAASSESSDEDYGEYVFAVTQAVSALRDERAIPALVGAIPASGVDLIQFGDKALGPIQSKLKSPDALIRATALEIAAKIWKTENDGVSRARVRYMIRSMLKDPSPVVRSAAAREILCLDKRQEFVPTLEQIAKSDPSRFPGQSADDGGDGGEFYPVRATVRRVLRNIQNNEACPP
jgi:HEAT repeat protein